MLFCDIGQLFKFGFRSDVSICANNTTFVSKIHRAVLCTSSPIMNVLLSAFTPSLVVKLPPVDINNIGVFAIELSCPVSGSPPALTFTGYRIEVLRFLINFLRTGGNGFAAAKELSVVADTTSFNFWVEVFLLADALQMFDLAECAQYNIAKLLIDPKCAYICIDLSQRCSLLSQSLKESALDIVVHDFNSSASLLPLSQRRLTDNISAQIDVDIMTYRLYRKICASSTLSSSSPRQEKHLWDLVFNKALLSVKCFMMVPPHYFSPSPPYNSDKGEKENRALLMLSPPVKRKNKGALAGSFPL